MNGNRTEDTKLGCEPVLSLDTSSPHHCRDEPEPNLTPPEVFNTHDPGEPGETEKNSELYLTELKRKLLYIDMIY